MAIQNRIILINMMDHLPILQRYFCGFDPIPDSVNELLAQLKKSLGLRLSILIDQDGLVHAFHSQKDELENRIWLEDSFRLSISHFPLSPKTFIPVDNGRIETNIENWEMPSEKMVAQVVKEVPGGILVCVGDERAFLPRTFIPESFDNQTAISERLVFECEVHDPNGSQPPVVRPAGPFTTFNEWMKLA